MEIKINISPSHSIRTIYRKKNLFCFTLLILLFIPFSVHSKDRRGMELTSKHQIHDKAWGTYYELIIGTNAQLDDLTGDGYWIPVEGKLKDPTTWISHLDIKSILCSEKVLGKNAERLQLENENQKLAGLETEKNLLEESKRLETERQRTEKEKELLEKRNNRDAQDQDASKESIKLAGIPESVSVPRVSLRKEGKLLGISDVKNMLIIHGFYEKRMNPQGDFKNDLIDNDNGTVTDRATGLMWQKSGSQSSLDRNRANTYINKLNKDQFAGYSDWRLPTIEEIASLIDRNKKNGVHVNSIFDIKQNNCWSSDQAKATLGIHLSAAWVVNFKIGEVVIAEFEEIGSNASRGSYISLQKYVRAVRSLN